MENYTVTVPATEQPVALAEAKDFMLITSTAQDVLITSLIKAATKQIENYTNQVFVVRTFMGEFSTLFTSNTETYPWVKVRRAPLNTITTVQISSGGSFIDESFQIKKPAHGFARILLDDFSTTIDKIPYPLQIEFSAGYGDASDVPEDIKLAIKELVNFMFRNRGDCIDASSCALIAENSGLPTIVKAIMSDYRIVEVFA